MQQQTRRGFFAVIAAFFGSATVARSFRRKKIGSTITVRRPARYVATDGAAFTPDDISYRCAVGTGYWRIVQNEIAADREFMNGDQWRLPA